MIFLSLGAPFVAALEIIVYAGAIIVLFIFVVMMLNLGYRNSSSGKGMVKAKSVAAAFGACAGIVG